MSTDRTNPEYVLLDWHLDRLDAEDRSWVEQELAMDAALRAKNDQLRRVLAPLDSWQASPASARLADKVLSFVRQSQASWDTSRPFAPSAPTGRGQERIRPFFRHREAIAIAACVVLLAGVSIPGISELRAQSQRAVCKSHLASIFTGLSGYQADSGGVLPYAGPAVAASWLPTAGGPFASNSRHAYLLAKMNLVPDLSAFLCPADASAAPMDASGRETLVDFRQASNISFDTLHVSGEAPNLRPSPTVAYMGDRNPLFLGGRFNDAVDPDHTNSPAHRGKGQTVLTLNGAAEFTRTPILGPAKDNVWLMDGVRSYSGTECSRQPDDSFLVPGFPGQSAH